MLNIWMMVLIFILAVLCVLVVGFCVIFSQTLEEIDRKLAKKIRGKENE